MIFGTSTQEIYWILSTLLKRYDIEIINKIIDMCEDYELIEKPMLPRYNCPQGLSEDEYLKDNYCFYCYAIYIQDISDNKTWVECT